MIEKLLKQTRFKNDAADIARQLLKRGIDDLEKLDNAPTLLGSTKIWGYDLYAVIHEIREAAKNIQASKSIETKPLASTGHFVETPASEPGKPVGGIK